MENTEERFFGHTKTTENKSVKMRESFVESIRLSEYNTDRGKSWEFIVNDFVWKRQEQEWMSIVCYKK